LRHATRKFLSSTRKDELPRKEVNLALGSKLNATLRFLDSKSSSDILHLRDIGNEETVVALRTKGAAGPNDEGGGS